MPEEYRPQCGDGAHGSTVYLEEIIKFLKPQGKVLDLGAGVGFKASYMRNQGCEVVALDIDISSLGELRRRDSNIDLVCADAQRLPFKSSTFDGVLACAVLEHLPEPELCVEELYRVMKTNAEVVFYTPVFNLHFGWLATFWRRISGIKNAEEVGHLQIFSTGSLKKLLRSYFFIEDILFRGYTDALLNVRLKYDKDELIDRKLIWLGKRLPILNLFASKIWIKAKKVA